MQIFELAEYLNTLEGVSSRLEMTSILAEVFLKLDKEETRPACYLLQGQLLPQYRGLEFQISVKTIVKVLARLLPDQEEGAQDLFGHSQSDVAEEIIQKKYQQHGDLGKVAAEVMAAQGRNTFGRVSVKDVYDQLLVIAKDAGAQSQQRKQEKTLALLNTLDPVSAKFVVKILLGRLRLGFSDMTMMDALSWAMKKDKSEHELLESAYQRRADIGLLAEEYLQVKDEAKRQKLLREGYSVKLGVPVVPALCQRLNNAVEVIEKMKEVIAEPKYDGMRVQIHFQKQNKNTAGILRTFTRNLEESSAMFPELQKITAQINCQSCILDTEAIGYDPKTGHFIPFQQTIQRKRKHGIAEKAVEVPVRFYVFDLLYLNGRNLIEEPLTERKAKLKNLFTDNEVLVHTEELRTKDPLELHHYHQHALAEGLEGIVMKQASSAYQSGRKGWSWVKMKEAEGQSGKLNDTVDVIVMGYYYGRGKRAGFGLGAFLVGVLDTSTQQVLTIAKIGTGLTEETLMEVKRRCDELRTDIAPAEYQVNKMLIPDVWCLPGLVVEVAADELTTSPTHTAGQALRFPRFIRFRDDKNWDQATTMAELQSIQVSR